MKKKYIFLLACSIILVASIFIGVRFYKLKKSDILKSTTISNQLEEKEINEEPIQEKQEEQQVNEKQENHVENVNNINTQQTKKETNNSTIKSTSANISQNVTKNAVTSTPIKSESSNSKKTTKKETVQQETKKPSTQKNDILRCTTISNHGTGVGNSNKWFNSKSEAIAYYNDLINKLGEKWEKFEIDDDTYYKSCPYGYEVWTCPYCSKWTINFYYR